MSRPAAALSATAPPPEKSPYRPETAVEILAAHPGFLKDSAAPSWLAAVRREGAEQLAAEGLPTPRLERWKYTNLPPAVRGIGAVANAVPAISGGGGFASVIRAADAPAWLQPILARPPAGAARYKDMGLWHLGQAYLDGVILVDVPAGKIVENIVDISYGTAPGFAAPRLIVRLGEGAELTLIERYPGGTDKSWLNETAQIVVGRNARLRHYRLQDQGQASVHTQEAHVTVGRDGGYEGFTLTRGAVLSRGQVQLELTEPNASCHLYGINLLRGKQLGDTTITVEHQAPNCQSNQLYRSVLDNQAHGVFQGKVHVHQVAQKTDGYQLSNALILSEGAEMDTKPELEIYADDVKCSHGATTGQLDDQALFYLRSRGLGMAEARTLLIQAFVGEIVDKLQDKSVEGTVTEAVASWLGS